MSNSITQMPVPPLNGPLPVDEQKRAQWSRPWGNWMTLLWQQIATLFTLSATVSTTDATVTTIATVTVPPSTTMMIEARVVGRRTGGSSGTAEDGAAYVIYAAYKNAAGTATEIGETAVFTAEDQSGWNATLTPSGANVNITVKGAADNNVDWLVQYRTQAVT